MEGSLHRTTKVKVEGSLHRTANVPNRDGNISRTTDHILDLRRSTIVQAPALTDHRAITDLQHENAMVVVREALRRKEASAEMVTKANPVVKEVPVAAREALSRGSEVGSPCSARRRSWILFSTMRQ